MADGTEVVKIGVFIPSECQLLDMACIDVLFMMSREYLGGLPTIPKHIPELAPSVEIFYITAKASSPNPNPEDPDAAEHRRPLLLPLTAGVKIQPTHDVSSPEVQPGMLDILLVPGPDPGASWDEDTLGFLRGHVVQEEEEEEGKRATDVLSVCTGVFLCGAAGVLDGRKVCGPRGLQDVLRKRFPGAMFVGDEFRWCRDGNFWSCGGITNGNDLVAAYARSSERRLFPAPIVEIACKMAEVGERGQMYEQGQTRFTLGFVWLLVKAWFVKPSN
ncbi:ThiJ/PfpI family protein [Colletotrichum phormii]|uniref:ThiJ/PfpI family protein n=1 Tax=Colletotrichum phormii TaxID=359342 RepID=A0AAI9ZVP6_9PEZI|nr:ThiJ/PfpI family protein [Colletotrichum phormii]KAK1639072.1 ThiJ/PfpI family protein [Colletotrichum phormii]